jgi:hypothetical protein
MQRTPELNDAIEELYRVFASYPLHKPFLGCPCCHKEGHNLVIESKPLRALTYDDIQQYASDAITTWGDEDDFRHFLPRIFELLPESVSSHLSDAEIILGKLHYANWEQWPAPERMAFHNYLRALWRAAIEYSYGEDDWDENPGGWLCAIAQAEHDLTPYLSDWIAAPSTTAVRNLVSFILNEVDFTRREVHGAFWDNRKPQAQQVFEWVCSPAVLDTLRSFPEEDPQAKEFLAHAVTVLQ